MKKILSIGMSIAILVNCTCSPTLAYGSGPPSVAHELAIYVKPTNDKSKSIIEIIKKILNMKNIKTMFKNTSQIGLDLKNISDGISSSYFYYSIAKKAVNNITMRMSKIKQNVDSVVLSLDEELKLIKGQEAAKKKMQEIVASIIDSRNEAKEKGIPYKKGDVIYMIGPSGVGKSFSAECLAKAIMGPSAKPIYIDASDIDKDSGLSIKEQLFYMREGQPRGESMNYYQDTSLVSQIKTNPKVVLIINEYDKMHTSDFDEVLRTIMDRGQLCIGNEKIDCSGLLIIITSNEDHSSVTCGKNEGELQDDGTGSRTHVYHDKSFLNRLHIVEFDNLNEAAYESIATDVLNEIAERYQKQYSINLFFGDTAKKIAVRTAKTNQGAREIDKIVAGLKTAIIKLRQSNNKTLNSSNNKSYKVDYNENDNEFTLTEINDIDCATGTNEHTTENK